jgi:hypothetical protein
MKPLIMQLTPSPVTSSLLDLNIVLSILWSVLILTETSFLREIILQKYSIVMKYARCGYTKKKRKAVPLHAMEAHGGRGCIAPIQS